MKDKYYSKAIEEIENILETNIDNGLKHEDVIKARDKYGENALEEKAGKTIWKMILEQVSDFMIIILILAAVLSMIAGEFIDGAVILGIVVLNAVLGITQERKASDALAALKSMAAPKAKVIRKGILDLVDSKDLVPGDVVVLESGDYVPADLVLFESVNMKIDESALTGESVAVDKEVGQVEDEAPIGDRVNSAFMSTIVTYGRGKGIVVSTGMSTEIGKIATMLNETEDEKSPLQEKLASFGKLLGMICIGVCIIIFGLGLYRGEELLEVFMTAISLAVAAIPEGLPAVVTVVLAMGVTRMVSRHAIMKNISAVETLGSTTVICTDKTGTLTQNKMTVLKVYDGSEEWQVTGTGYSFDGEIASESDKDKSHIEKLLQTAVLCNDAKIKDEQVIGDPTEGALVVLAAKGGFDQASMNQSYPRLSEFPFDSVRKLMSTKHQIDESYYMFTKGAPDEILARSTKILIGNEVRDITDEDKKRILDKNKAYAEQALRVLGYTYKPVDSHSDLFHEENDLIFLGLTCMIDPPRQEAIEAVKLCKKAGIRVVMITGDHITTASAIAKQLGIIQTSDETLKGSKINDYNDEDFKEKVKSTSVFARVSPEHKVRIVETVKSNGDVAAMTGDGVNDAPALKRADIGIAMGITGTDVSKEAADMILTDDNFASIVDAVEEGRIIYSNIRKFVGFLLSCNIGEILIIFIAMLAGWPVPLVPIQLLWINLITDSFPAFALGLEKGEKDIMDKKPRDPSEPIVDKTMKIALAFQSIGLTVAVLTSYRLGFLMAGDVSSELQLTIARTFSFTTLIIGEMLRAFSAKSEYVSVFKMKIFDNKYLNYSVFGAIVLLLIVVYLPFLQPIFSTATLSLNQLGLAVGLGIVPLLFGEIAKKVK
ncbi:cation-transporting P-type ATPase [Acidaminobacter sp. JC074]|uniref:cation-translocating P-type ATPase n=1 Tax=Acidaminobacter sp. JC074 TaxID=2530199 RepID=UPI001F0E879C